MKSKFFAFLLLFLLVASIFSTAVSAEEYPAYNYMANGEITVVPQPFKTETTLYGEDFGVSTISGAQDLCCAEDGTIYVSDTERNQIVVRKADGSSYSINSFTMNEEVLTFNKPQGVFVTDKNLYVCDYGNNRIVIIEFETGKKLGKHKGFWFHTIGQRKGLGLGGGPWFVVKKDTERNLIFVSKGYDPAAQYVNNIDLLDVMTMNPAIQFNDGQRVRYKIRHQPGFNFGILKLSESDDKLSIISEEAISGVAAGQFGIIYHETEPVVLGSGVIG